MNLTKYKKVKDSIYGVEGTLKEDKTTNNGVALKKGDKLSFDIVSKGPDSNWWLIPIKKDGKHVGYFETQRPDSLFDITKKGTPQADSRISDARKKKISDAVLNLKRNNSISAIVKALFEAADTKGVSRKYLRLLMKPIFDDTESPLNSDKKKDSVNAALQAYTAGVNETYKTSVAVSGDDGEIHVVAPLGTDYSAIDEVIEELKREGYEFQEELSQLPNDEVGYDLVFKPSGLSE